MSIDFSTIDQGDDSGYESLAQLVINQQSLWSDVWQHHTANTDPVPSLPKVDFARNSVIAVFAGEKPTGGYSIEIQSIEANGSACVVTICDREPDADEFVTEAVTYPYHIIRVPKIAKAVFQEA